MINWNQIEEILYRITSENIKEIAQEHSDETFYCFALSINADYGEIMISLNTNEFLEETAKDYFTRRPERYKSLEKAKEKLKLSIGDWKYTDENSEDFQDTWGKYQELISDEALDQDEELEETDQSIEEQFLRTACRVIHRINNEEVIKLLNQTEDFEVYVCDHDETDEKSWQRLKETKLQNN